MDRKSIPGIKFFQEKVVFLPKRLSNRHVYIFKEPFHELFLSTPHNGYINAIHFYVPHPHGIILYFHGNANNLNRWGHIASYFTQYNFDVFIIDYRGYGKSKGERTEHNLFSDAIYCYDYLQELFPEKPIIIYGRSLGGAMAVKTASERPTPHLLLENPFYNLQDMAKRLIPAYITDKLSPFMPYWFDSASYIHKVNTSITLFHGTRDRVVPYGSGKKLYQTIPHNNKQLITFPGGGHGNLNFYSLYHETIKKILTGFASMG